MRRLAKIMITMGPSTSDYAVVKKMMAAGADGFRINMSHGDEKQWSSFIELVDKASQELGVSATKVADLEGPRVRLGEFQGIDVTPGQQLRFKFAGSQGDGIPVDNRAFFTSVERGDRVLVDDGKVVLSVEDVERDAATLRVISGQRLEPRKGVVISGKEYDLPPVTGKDLNDIKFIAANSFDYVMASFVRSARHVEVIRRALEDAGVKKVRLLAKIETPSGVNNIDSILDVVDGIIVARGDLGMHFPLEDIPVIQRRIIEAARRKLKPVILATEIFMSMIERPLPTRGEISDVYAGIEEGVDGFLVTSETSIGRYPVDVVSWLSRVIEEANKNVRPRRVDQPLLSLETKVSKGVVEMAQNVGASVVVYAHDFDVARLISAFRPSTQIYVGVPTPQLARQLSLIWGVSPVIVGAVESEDQGLELTEKELKSSGVVGPGSLLVELSWTPDRSTAVVKVKQLL
ncbi:MAG: pyruvate kinase [Acidilobus sp.]